MDGGIGIKNKPVILLGIFLILLLISGIGSAAEIIVQPGNSIQTAINNANSGDTITIKSGTYTENINITKSNLIIRSQSGNPDDTIIKAKSSSRNALFAQSVSNVTIKGIKVIGASGSSYAGIYLNKCSKCVVESNKLTNNGYGLRMESSSRCTISKNTAMDNGVYGIYLGSCSNSTVSGNTATNDARGIHVGSSDDNKLSGNTVTSNSVFGLYVCGLSDRNTIYNNYFNNTNMTIKNGSGNSYNTTKTAGKNIVGGTYIGGNFWGKPDGSGFSNKAVDKDGDGISDSAYSIPNSIYSDYLPLVTPSNPGSPDAEFSSNVTSGTAPLNVQFNDASTGNPTAWNWSFGDGTYSAIQNPTHNYSTAGNYTVALTVGNSAGNNTVTKTNYISVAAAQKPVLNYWGYPRSGAAPLTVTFRDNSSGSPTAWNWSFGDGIYSNEKNPVHTYTAAGNYTISLTASNVAGSTSSTKAKYITVTGNSSTIPVAGFSSNVTSGNAPLNVLFTDTSTGSPTAWNWNFGDGTSSAVQNPVHTYSTKGIYTVTLTASNAAGNNTVTKSNYITITDPSSQKPVASFSSNVTSGNVPLNVWFNDTSTGSPTAWSWSFGDGGTSTEKSPKHTYSTAGSYTVTLTASNSAGNNTTTKSNYITVTGNTPQAPVASFNSNVTSGNVPLNVLFTDTSTGNPTSWNWNFGDGGGSTEKSPKHTYSTAGNYTVTLTASNAAGNNTVTKSNYITAISTGTKPVLNYWGYPRSGAAPLTVTFRDNSSGSPTAWNWSFGDGTYSNEKNPKHTYTTAGSYTISLTATNAAGSTSSTKSKYITVTGNSSTMPVAGFSSNVTSGSAPLNVLFTDTSTGTPTSWNWNFGDGTSSTTKSPVHTYSAAGTYTVALTATNAAGSNTTTKSNYITVTTGTAVAKPALNYWGYPRSGTAPLTVSFKDNSTGSPTSWNWSFGDGASSTERNPKHTYSTAGSYTIKLTVTNAAGSTSGTKYNYIVVSKA